MDSMTQWKLAADTTAYTINLSNWLIAEAQVVSSWTFLWPVFVWFFPTVTLETLNITIN